MVGTRNNLSVKRFLKVSYRGHFMMGKTTKDKDKYSWVFQEVLCFEFISEIIGCTLFLNILHFLGLFWLVYVWKFFLVYGTIVNLLYQLYNSRFSSKDLVIALRKSPSIIIKLFTGHFFKSSPELFVVCEVPIQVFQILKNHSVSLVV